MECSCKNTKKVRIKGVYKRKNAELCKKTHMCPLLLCLKCNIIAIIFCFKSYKTKESYHNFPTELYYSDITSFMAYRVNFMIQIHPYNIKIVLFSNSIYSDSAFQSK